MKILSIGNFGYGWDGSICDEEHIAHALEDAGHTVVRVQRDNIRVPTDEFDSHHSYDFILVAQWDGYPHLDENGEGRDFTGWLKTFESPIVYWAFDYQADGQPWHERLVKAADLYLSKRIADSKYDNWQWLCQDFAPNFLDKFPGEVEQDIDILFTGSFLPWASERNNTLLAIQRYAIENKLNFQINSFNMTEWPQTFQNVRDPVMDDQLPRLIARAKVNISFDHTLEAGYWSDRNAQIMACGGLVLFRYVPCSTQVFGDYVEYFHNTEQCLEWIDFYLKNHGAREMKAKWGYEFAQANLTVEERAKDLIEIVGSVL